MERVLCEVPDKVASDLIDAGEAYRPLAMRSGGPVALAVLAVSADVVSLAASGPGIRTALDRLVTWARRDNDREQVLRIGDDVELTVRLPPEASGDPKLAVDLAARVLQVLNDGS